MSYEYVCLCCCEDFESSWKDRKFCSLSCSTTYNNLKRDKFTEETRKKIGAANKGRLVGDKNPAKRAAVREKISKAHKGRKVHWSHKWKGQKRPNTSRSLVLAYKEGRAKPNRYKKGGFRKDLGRYFRSSWEANCARCLNYMGVQWLYEPSVFAMEIEGKETTYRPDFYLPEMDIYMWKLKVTGLIV